MDIADFIRARLDEDEAVAKAATPGPWEPERPWLSDVVTSKLLGRIADFSSARVLNRDEGGYRPQSIPDARHVAHWDPARVLAETAAKRGILDAIDAAEKEWAEAQAAARPGPASFDLARARSLERELAEIVLRQLAAPYADHPDYDPAWRIDA